MNPRVNQLIANKYNLFWCRFFVELNALQAIMQLFYLHRGLNISEIFYLAISYALASLIFDIPTSFLADTWGRKKTIIVGVILNVLVNISLFFVYGYVPFFISTFFLSLSFTFFAGVEDAFLYDTLKELKQENLVLKTSGKYQIAARASKMIIPLIGAIVASNLSAIQFNYLVAINLITSIIAILFSMKLVEPMHSESLLISKMSLIKKSAREILSDRVLITIMLNKTLLSMACIAFWKFYQTCLVDLGSSVLMLGIIYLLSNLISIFVYSRTTAIFSKINKPLIFNIPVLIFIFGSVVFTMSQNLWLTYIVSILVITTGTIRDPFFNQQIQWRITSHNRATTSSVMGILKNTLDIPIFLIIGLLSNYGIVAIMSVPILMTVVLIIFFRLKKEDILLIPTTK